MSSTSLDLPIDLRKIGILHKKKLILYWEKDTPTKFLSGGCNKNILGYMLSGGQLSVMKYKMWSSL